MIAKFVFSVVITLETGHQGTCGQEWDCRTAKL
jgi:hypothetical protein